MQICFMWYKQRTCFAEDSDLRIQMLQILCMYPASYSSHSADDSYPLISGLGSRHLRTRLYHANDRNVKLIPYCIQGKRTLLSYRQNMQNFLHCRIRSILIFCIIRWKQYEEMRYVKELIVLLIRRKHCLHFSDIPSRIQEIWFQ